MLIDCHCNDCMLPAWWRINFVIIESHTRDNDGAWTLKNCSDWNNNQSVHMSEWSKCTLRSRETAGRNNDRSTKTLWTLAPPSVWQESITYVNVNHEFFAWLKQPKLLQSPRWRSTEFKLWCPEMTGETGMSLAVAGRKRQTVQTARRLAVFRKWRLRKGTSDDRLLTDGTAGCAAAAWTTTADGNGLAVRRHRDV